MQVGLSKLEQLMSGARALTQRHWQGALRIREHLRFSEGAFHLVLAGGVGVIGGLVNLVFHAGIEISQTLFLHQAGDVVQVAENSGYAVRLLVPTVGGLLAGLVLYWGLRLVGKQG